ncbi:TIGR00730 family Rossman fold protein [Corynebacterium pacaense]|uniref:LOG family protein n=1 Tax=Corynebacterium pacaense TaxID=1816684 RepID=UPI0009B9F5FA|nr:TIGR00730 family Rossman fold protein [Corynebacterium pacaense]
MISRVAVYCGSVPGTRPGYAAAARELGQELAHRGIELVYGGGNVGLMGELADACLDIGGEVTGVIPRALVDREMAHPHLSRLEVVASMAQRKALMEELSDAFIVLPGGIGTLEEFFQVATRQQLGPEPGPVGFYNVDGFWTPLLEMLRHLVAEGFYPQKYVDAFVVAQSGGALLDGLENWVSPGRKWE